MKKNGLLSFLLSAAAVMSMTQYADAQDVVQGGG